MRSLDFVYDVRNPEQSYVQLPKDGSISADERFMISVWIPRGVSTTAINREIRRTLPILDNSGPCAFFTKANPRKIHESDVYDPQTRVYSTLCEVVSVLEAVR